MTGGRAGGKKRGTGPRIPVIGGLIARRGAARLCEAAARGDPEAVTGLIDIVLSAGDGDRVNIAMSGLSGLPTGPAIDRFCAEAILSGDPLLLGLVERESYRPADQADGALFEYLLGKSGPDPALVRAGFSRAIPELRKKTLELVCRQGDAVQFASRSGKDEPDAGLDDREWELLTGGLAREGRFWELWRLAFEVAPPGSARILTMLRQSGWQPGQEERQTWKEISESSPDGRRSGCREMSCDIIEGGAGWVGPMAVTPDGNFLLSGGGDGIVRAWRLPDGELADTFRGAGGNITDIAIATDGSIFAAGTSRGPVMVAGLVPGRGPPIVLEGHAGGTRCVVFSGDGVLYSGGYDGILAAWDPQDGHQITNRQAHSGELLCMAISPDGRTLATGGSDGIVRTWTLPGLEPDRCSVGHTDWVRVVLWMPDGRTLASAGSDCTIRVWSCERCVRVLRGHEDAVRTLAAVPGGLVSGGDRGSLLLWRLPDSRPAVVRSGHRGHVTRLVPAGDGGALLSAGADGIIRQWDSSTLELIRTMKGHSGEVKSLLITPGGTIAASGSWDGTVRLWTLPDGLLIRALQARPRSISSLSVLSAGSMMAAGLSDGTLRMLALPGGEHAGVVEGHNGEVSALAGSSDGRFLASAGSDGMIRILNMPGAALAVEIRGHEGGIGSLAFGPDGNLLASGGWDEVIRLWSLPDGGELARIAGHRSVVTSLAFTPDGRYLASGSNDTTVRLWEIPEGKACGRPLKHGAVVTSVAITEDGTLLASGGWDRCVRLWRLPSGEPAGTISGLPGRVTSLAITPDGRLIGIGCEEGGVHLRTLPGGLQEMGHLSLRRKVTALAATPDGRALAIAGVDGAVRFWSLPWTSPLSQAGPPDLEYVEEMRRRFPGSGKGGWDFVRALMKGRFRNYIEYGEPAAPAGEYDIEFGY